uniref:30S ribosomal protein S4 n=1 Tax=Spongospora subterranea TaxID=70186 RepID=A0A096XTW2_9EUKA|nr:30S ribosomal protein S4 [Spongospora subterranea]AIK19919.1 30S ribosomal protein S4 [Spongospora subterranea]
MQSTSLTKFKKNSKLIRLTKLYFDLLKTKHLLNFFIGGLKRHQLLNLYQVASTRQLFLSFLSRLEYRIEVILVKSGFVLTGKQAKQLVLHNKVCVNNKKIKSCLVALKVCDRISLSNLYITKYKLSLICNLYKTSFFLIFKEKKINKKIAIQRIFGYFKFPCFLEINFKTSTIYIVKKPVLQEFFLPKILSLYDFNQLHFIL